MEKPVLIEGNHLLSALQRIRVAAGSGEMANTPSASDNFDIPEALTTARARNFPKFMIVHPSRLSDALDWDIFAIPLLIIKLFTPTWRLSRRGYTVLLAFTAAGMAYRAFHLVAWDYPFSSPTQKILWKLSGLTIAASGPAFLFKAALFQITLHGLEIVSWRWLRIVVRSLSFADAFIIVPAFVLLYLFARVYLVVACFLTFPYLPDGVFQQPQWSYDVPHIS